MADQLKQRDGDQPLPITNDHPDIQSLVIADVEARRQVGISRTALQPLNGRDTLRDAYEEAMDLTTYLRSVIAERDDVNGVAAIQAELRSAKVANQRLVDVMREVARHLDGISRWQRATDGEIQAAVRPMGQNLRDTIDHILEGDAGAH